MQLEVCWSEQFFLVRRVLLFYIQFDFRALHTNSFDNLATKQKKQLHNENPPSHLFFLRQLKGPLPNHRKIRILHRVQHLKNPTVNSLHCLLSHGSNQAATSPLSFRLASVRNGINQARLSTFLHICASYKLTCGLNLLKTCNYHETVVQASDWHVTAYKATEKATCALCNSALLIKRYVGFVLLMCDIECD